MKIFERIKIIPKGVITKIQRSKAKFELEKSYFDTTRHYKFGGLEYEETARSKK